MEETYSINTKDQRFIVDANEIGDVALQNKQFFRFRDEPSSVQASVLGIIGAATFFAIWEVSHLLTPDFGKRFLPAVEEVLAQLYYLYTEKGFLADVLISCARIFGSFFLACAVAVPLGIAMGCFANLRALINPTVSGWRYLPAASFIPLLLVWLGPSEGSKIGLLFLGVIFFLIAMVLDNTRAVQREFIEAALTMGASRKRIVLEVVVPAVAPQVIELDAHNDRSRLDLPCDCRNRRCAGWHRRRDDAGGAVPARRHHHGWYPDDRHTRRRD